MATRNTNGEGRVPNRTPLRITDAIQRLHARREALNIHAVRRNHPHLLANLHGGTVFRSWRDAVLDCGLSYADLRTQLAEVCECPYCGAEKANLATHLRTAHDIDPSLYRMEYPEQDLISERLRADKSQMRANVLRHWEPLWSREYVLERAHEFVRRGIPIDSSWIARNDKPFYAAGIRYFKRWNAIIEAIGCDPDQATHEAHLRARRYPDRDAVLREIRRRRRQGVPINSSAVRPAVYVRKASHAYDTALHLCAEQYFGSWDNALREAGFNPSEVRRTARPAPQYTSKASVCRELQRRHEQHLPLKVIQVLTGKSMDSAIIVTARTLFGSWHAALRAAGVPIPEADRKGKVGPPRRYPTKQSVVQAIRIRDRRGLPLNNAALFKSRHMDTALFRSGVEFFRNWVDAVRSAGVDPRKARLRTGPKPRASRT